MNLRNSFNVKDINEKEKNEIVTNADIQSNIIIIIKGSQKYFYNIPIYS
jgi:3'-phosphoadenosine 5'-phosphosulfate (PAPS) 3'-phosphatase